MFPEDPKKKDDEAEKDIGFGRSHGYDKQHGGPTGPGDAPAKPAPKKVPNSAAMSDAFRLACRESHRKVLEIGSASLEHGASHAH